MKLREGKLISEWKDEHGNRVLIEEVETKPYKKAKLKHIDYLVMRNMTMIFVITFQFLVL